MWEAYWIGVSLGLGIGIGGLLSALIAPRRWVAVAVLLVAAAIGAAAGWLIGGWHESLAGGIGGAGGVDSRRAGDVGEHVPIHGYDLEPIAKMPRRVMQQRGNLVSMRARRCRQVEEIVSLVGIEPTEFLAEDRLVVGGERRSPDSVIDKIHLAAEVGIPDEPRIVVREVLGAEVEIVARKKLDRALGGNGRGARDHRERAERATNHSEPLSALSSASFASSSSMRFFSSGRRRKTAAARRHSRASIAG